MAHIIGDEARSLDRERENILAALRALRAERFSLDHREYALTQGARALAATWEQIGDALERYPDEAERCYAQLGKQIGP